MKALVLGGGGSRGSWQVGVLEYLYLTEKKKYDIIVGSSVGALNAAALAQFPRGEESAAYKWLYDLWSNLRNKDVYRKWYYGLLGRAPLLWKPSMYDNAPLKKLVRKNLTKGVHPSHILAVGATCYRTGEYEWWSSTSDDFETHMGDYIIASSAVPGYFPPHLVRGRFFMDAGLRELTPVKSAILLGAKELDIVIPSVRTKAEEPKKTIKVVSRALSIMIKEIDKTDVDIPSISELDFRVIRPQSFLYDESLDFNTDHLVSNIHTGYLDAQKVWG